MLKLFFRGSLRDAHPLDRPVTTPSPNPVFTASNIQYDVASKTRAIACGGIGAIQLLVCKLGLAHAIDQRLHLLKFHFSYHESDHVLNFAYNALCNGTGLDDIELRRNDVVFLDALDADRIPDPTTAGDFCRRFTIDDVETLQDVFDQTRGKVWKQQPSGFFDEAVIDADGSLVATGAGCKLGVDIAYNGTWVYHPLIVSLANTGEVLSIVNRPGNRLSHEGAAEQIDLAILLCRDAGFRWIYLRGDTDFTQTTRLDAWDAEQVMFLFGVDAMPNLKAIAEDLFARDGLGRVAPTAAGHAPGKIPQTPRKGQGPDRPRAWVQDADASSRGRGRGRVSTDGRPADLPSDHRPPNDQGRGGPVAVARRNPLPVHLTNDRVLTPRALVFKANDRCDQENLLAQLKGRVHALRAAVDNLVSNWAYMVMTALAWNLKAWFALSVPEHPRHKEVHRVQKRGLLRMEFKRFVNAIILMPCQIVRGGQRLLYRLLSWNEWQGVFLRVVHALHCTALHCTALRC